jgi:hypothetical protein
MSNRAAAWLLALSLWVLVVMTLVFVPDAIRIVYAFVTNFQSRGLDVLSDYSAVSMAFFLVVCLAFILAIYLAYFTRRLFILKDKLNPYR